MSDEWTNAGGAAHPAHDDGLSPLAIAAGLVAAVIGGAIWAAIAIFGDVEVGWVAWGIGALVGGAMALTTPVRSRRLAVVAAALALVGLAGGKAATFAGSAGPVAEQMMADEAYMQAITAWQMYGEGTLPPALQATVKELEVRGDTLTDAAWAQMLAAADAELATMSEDEKRFLARASAAAAIEGMGLVAGVSSQLGAFDLLWVALALFTAFRIMDAPKPAPVVANETPERDGQPV